RGKSLRVCARPGQGGEDQRSLSRSGPSPYAAFTGDHRGDPVGTAAGRIGPCQGAQAFSSRLESTRSSLPLISSTPVLRMEFAHRMLWNAGGHLSSTQNGPSRRREGSFLPRATPEASASLRLSLPK